MQRPGPFSKHTAVARGVERERRREPRQQIQYVRCWSPAPGSILNVSPCGLAIETFEEFQPGDSVFLTINLGGSTYRLPGKVRWRREIAVAGPQRSPVFHLGLALAGSQLSSEWLAALRSGPAAPPVSPSAATG